MQKIIELIELERQYRSAIHTTQQDFAQSLQAATTTFQEKKDQITRDLANKDQVIADQVSHVAPVSLKEMKSLPTVGVITQKLLSLIS